MREHLDAVLQQARAIPGVAAAEVVENGEAWPAVRIVVAAHSDSSAVAAAASGLLLSAGGGDPSAPSSQPRSEAAARDIGAPGTGEAAADPPLRASRPRLVSTELTTAGASLAATVVLDTASRAATGRATGLLTSAGAHWTVAQATLSALDQLAPAGSQFVLEHVEARGAPSDGTVVTRVALARRGTVERLVGAATVRGDSNDAVVRATLDACNRRFEVLAG